MHEFGIHAVIFIVLAVVVVVVVHGAWFSVAEVVGAGSQTNKRRWASRSVLSPRPGFLIQKQITKHVRFNN